MHCLFTLLLHCFLILLLGYLFTVTKYKYAIKANILITKHFANIKGAIYGNRLPKLRKWKNVGNH